MLMLLLFTNNIKQEFDCFLGDIIYRLLHGSNTWVIILPHIDSIISAYGTSAYFEYYQDELFAILESCPDRLFDLNMALLKFFIEKTGIAVDVRLTEDYLVSPDMQEEKQEFLKESLMLHQALSLLNMTSNVQTAEQFR